MQVYTLEAFFFRSIHRMWVWLLNLYFLLLKCRVFHERFKTESRKSFNQLLWLDLKDHTIAYFM
jgi:hypothetical protein